MRTRAIVLFFFYSSGLIGSGHGPVFGLATPTNPRGGYSLDYNLMGRQGSQSYGWMSRVNLGYGITEDLKLSVSMPVVHRQEALAPARVAGFTPMGNNAEGMLLWRFHRQEKGVGSRLESTLLGAALVPGPQAGSRGAGGMLGLVSGYASRSHYLWGGGMWQRSGARNAGFSSLVYGYRPQAWRSDYPRWDWRLFWEVTGEHQAGSRVFAGPSTLGLYKNIAVAGGFQWAVRPGLPQGERRERFRWALSLAYFF